MKPIHLSKAEARQMALESQLLLNCGKLLSGPEGVLEIIRTLSYLQIDTIAVIQRAHHHTLQTRCPDYNPGWLHVLQSDRRDVFEYWGHAMSYLPMADYRYSLKRMQNFLGSKNAWAVHLMERGGELMETVLNRIRAEGPLGAKDFQSDLKTGGPWWGWKPAKAALELLFWRGDLMIAERRNFHKIYDLTERVLPPSLNISQPDDSELGQFIVRRALGSMGVAEEREIQKFLQPDSGRDSAWRLVDQSVIRAELHALIESTEVAPVLVEDSETIQYCLRGSLARGEKSNQSLSEVKLLSPFDNLIIQRNRAKRLFDFDYTLECYVPAPKRKYGYFVLPILWGNRFAGRFDPKANRKTKTLEIHSIHFEFDFKPDDVFLAAFGRALNQFAQFNECETVAVHSVYPSGWVRAIRKYLKSDKP